MTGLALREMVAVSVSAGDLRAGVPGSRLRSPLAHALNREVHGRRLCWPEALLRGVRVDPDAGGAKLPGGAWLVLPPWVLEEERRFDRGGDCRPYRVVLAWPAAAGWMGWPW